MTKTLSTKLVTEAHVYYTPNDEVIGRAVGKLGECFRCHQIVGDYHTQNCTHVLFPSLDIKHSDESHAWIQWKGTQVCMDIRCDCGVLGHIDGDFTYHIKCHNCGQVYECDGHIVLHKLDFEPENTQTTEE